MAKKQKRAKHKPVGGEIRMGPIVWSAPQPATPRPVGGVVIMGPIAAELTVRDDQKGLAGN